MPCFNKTIPIVDGFASVSNFRRARSRQIESRHDVRDDHNIVAVDFADARFAVVRVRDGHDCVRVGVIDKLVRQHRVQNRFDRWRRRAGTCHLRGELVHHLRIRQRIQLRELQQVRHPNRDKSLRLDRLQIPAAAFDVKDLFFFAEDIAFP